MANPFQQKALQRKVVYLALIVVLFTVSLLHRRLLERQADNLQLREQARGEVELTSSFVQLALTGSRGLATTILWATAMDRMAKHEWNELELIVNSIGALQPYFVTPWLFQSWNLAFNVAVECDRPRDKYYYVSRGLELLAEGERRHQGTAELAKQHPGTPSFPGNPEMRHFVGFYYQLKIGNSDENSTMRSLFEMSCIDPIQRNPQRFRLAGQEEIDRNELQRFCHDHPRLVRRLREKLGYEDPKQIVEFLEKNQDVPTRFKKAVGDLKRSELEEPRKQFPVLPPVAPREARSETGPRWPNAREYELTPESIDVFLFCRTWYQYAQEPLPPPDPDPGVIEKKREHDQRIERDRKEKNINYRIPKTMYTPIFRGYPPRGQLYIAENLEGEGWFDDEGWAIKDWFNQAGAETDLRVGTEAKYHTQPQWVEAHRMYQEYGLKNGLYIPPAQIEELEKKAQAVRAALRINPTDLAPPSSTIRARFPESFDAHQKLVGSARDRSTTNFDAHLYQTEAEKDPQTVLGRKLVYFALQYYRKNQHEALPLFEQAWPVWIEVALRYPNFFQVSYVQDDLYEPMLRYMRLTQIENTKLFRNLMLGMAQASVWPHPNWEQWKWIQPSELEKVVSVRAAQGPLEMVACYNGPRLQAVRDDWFLLTFVASRLGQAGFAPPVPMPEQPNFALAGSIWERKATPPAGWRYLIDAQTAMQVRTRLGLIRPPEAPPEMGSPGTPNPPVPVR
jgi:hypothetical protein